MVDSLRVAIQHVGMRCGFLFGFVIDLLLLLLLNNSESERMTELNEKRHGVRDGVWGRRLGIDKMLTKEKVRSFGKLILHDVAEGGRMVRGLGLEDTEIRNVLLE